MVVVNRMKSMASAERLEGALTFFEKELATKRSNSSARIRTRRMCCCVALAGDERLICPRALSCSWHICLFSYRLSLK